MCKKPKYEDLIDAYINGNRKDFAFKVKLYGLGDFVKRVAMEVRIDQHRYNDPNEGYDMIDCAVRLGGYE